jgi:hypothetical protein
MKRWARVAPFFLIGPVSGPLLAGAIFSFREGKPVRGALYTIALVAFVVLLPTLTVSIGRTIH